MKTETDSELLLALLFWIRKQDESKPAIFLWVVGSNTVHSSYATAKEEDLFHVVVQVFEALWMNILITQICTGASF